MEHWKKHFRSYDLLQFNTPGYVKTMKFHLRYLKGCNLVLDSGAGTGNLTLELLKQGSKAYAVDNNTFGLQLLKKKCKAFDRLVVKKLDLNRELPFDNNEFDGIASMIVVHFIENQEIYLKENYRVLKEGGIFTVSTWLPKKGIADYWMKVLERNLKRKNLFKKYREEFEALYETSIENEKIIMKNTKKDAFVRLLRKAGFNKVKIEKEKPFSDYSVLITCKK